VAQILVPGRQFDTYAHPLGTGLDNAPVELFQKIVKSPDIELAA
jgi:hypothetical protein